MYALKANLEYIIIVIIIIIIIIDLLYIVNSVSIYSTMS